VGESEAVSLEGLVLSVCCAEMFLTLSVICVKQPCLPADQVHAALFSVNWQITSAALFLQNDLKNLWEAQMKLLFFFFFFF